MLLLYPIMEDVSWINACQQYEVLPSIVDAVGGRVKILVDGGIRSGVDIFKALAMEQMLLCWQDHLSQLFREKEGIELLVKKLGNELTDTMKMCGAYSLMILAGIWCPVSYKFLTSDKDS